jgi:hypothetical protein
MRMRELDLFSVMGCGKPQVQIIKFALFLLSNFQNKRSSR